MSTTTHQTLKPTNINVGLFSKHEERVGETSRHKRNARKTASKRQTAKDTGIGNTDGVEDEAVKAQEDGKVILVNWEEVRPSLCWPLWFSS